VLYSTYCNIIAFLHDNSPSSFGLILSSDVQCSSFEPVHNATPSRAAKPRSHLDGGTGDRKNVFLSGNLNQSRRMPKNVLKNDECWGRRSKALAFLRYSKLLLLKLLLFYWYKNLKFEFYLNFDWAQNEKVLWHYFGAIFRWCNNDDVTGMMS